MLNHAWWDPSTFADVGHDRRRADRRAVGRHAARARRDVRINRAVVEHDVTLIVGPVFPHEVVGFSGGNKYLFPGVSGQELIDLSHWLGALITSAEIIGTRGITPVRALINEAASLVPGERLAFCVVDQSRHAEPARGRLRRPEAAWAAAADVSAETHVRYLDAPVRRVLSLIPRQVRRHVDRRQGLLQGRADRRRRRRGRALRAAHPRDQRHAPAASSRSATTAATTSSSSGTASRTTHWGDLAHSTHLRGAGTYDAVDGERDRVTVTLATGIPEALVRAINLGYLRPGDVDPDAWAADPDTLVVPDAGEVLYRLR